MKKAGSDYVISLVEMGLIMYTHANFVVLPAMYKEFQEATTFAVPARRV